MTRTRGFLLGKFMPPHEGHLLLCDVASDLVDELTVLVCSRDCEPIPGNLRLNWMKESLGNKARVLHLHQEIPQEPREHQDFWNIWRRTIRELHPEPIDMVFGSEEYILRLAAELEAEPFIVDKERKLVPVSATQIRNNPQLYWEHIPRTVRPFFQKRICILGPESTGKSELSQKLANHFNTLYLPEYGRDYDARYRQGKDWQASDFTAIARGHQALRRKLGQRSGYFFIEDTDLLQTIVWAEYLLGRIPADLERLLEKWEFAAFYLLLKPDVVWLDDGTRYSGDSEVREWFFDKLQTILSDLKLPFKVISGGDWSSREQAAIAAVSRIG